MTNSEISLSTIATEEALSRMSDMEKLHIQCAIHAGKMHGFGNVMAWMATAWAHSLIDGGLDMDGAIDCVSCREPMLYPFSALEKTPEQNKP